MSEGVIPAHVGIRLPSPLDSGSPPAFAGVGRNDEALGTADACRIDFEN